MPSYNQELAQIGNRIYRRRQELGLSGSELAILADMSASTLSNIENGQRNVGIESICAIAKALKVPLSCLQPKALDAFSERDPEMREIDRRLALLSADQRALMLAMFSAQLDTVLHAAGMKNYRI